MSFPEGQVDTRFGTLIWRMTAVDTMVIAGDELTIHQVLYNGVATLHRKKGQWEALFGDIYLARVRDVLVNPTRAALAAFKRQAMEIAKGADCEKIRQETKVAQLRAEMKVAYSEITRLKEEINEHMDRIKIILQELNETESSEVEPVPA